MLPTARPLLKVSALLPQRTLAPASHRFFSCTTQRWNEDQQQPPADQQQQGEETAAPAAEEEQAEPIKLSRRRRRFHEWVKDGSGARFVRPSQGTTNYLGSTPFPNNPLFQPRPPLSDQRRQEIYDTYASDPQEWSIRKLATKYNISMRRVEAILKLKESEKELEMKGVALQSKFSKGMEKLMGADQTVQILQEPLVDLFPKVKKPTFKLVEEHESFTEKDAAKELNRKPIRQLEEKVIAMEEAKFAKSRIASEAIKSTTPTSSSKQKRFVIVDTSR